MAKFIIQGQDAPTFQPAVPDYVPPGMPKWNPPKAANGNDGGPRLASMPANPKTPLLATAPSGLQCQRMPRYVNPKLQVRRPRPI
jgi:hypothetical protein